MKSDIPKKIVFLEAVQDYGGARISTVELAERLAKIHHVTLIDFYGSCVPFLNDVEKRNLNIQIVDKRDTPYIINRSANASVLTKLINYLLYVPHWLKMRKGTIKALQAAAPDYVVINNYKVMSGLMFYPQKTFSTLFFARGWFIQSQISGIQRFMLKKWVDKFLCVSQSTMQALYCGRIAKLENLFVVPNAIDELRISKEKADIIKGPNTTVILHAGGFLKDKGQLASLTAAKKLKDKGVDFKLLFAGIIYKDSESEGFYKYLLDLVKELDLSDNVEFIVNKPNVISYFNACDILIHPSATEGLPRVVMEAMILKKPVIANAVGGVVDYILNGFTGFLTHFNDPDDYVKHIEALINDQELYNSISTNAYKMVKETYTEQHQIDSLFKAFNK
ncbi:MAG: glycosyltransferase family 4 protein [Mucilaginibacter sp.]|nr:glycosyltransferase family 4 protein [Mucilaginibacter sp.]